MVMEITNKEIKKRKKKNEAIPLCRNEADYIEFSKIGSDEYIKKYPDRLKLATYSNSKTKLK